MFAPQTRIRGRESLLRAIEVRGKSRLTTQFCSWVRSRQLSLHLLAAPVIGFLFLALVAPLVSIVLTSFYQRGDAGVIVKSLSLQNYVEFLTTPVYLQILFVSMLIGIVVALVSVVLGYAPACVLALNRSDRKHLLLLLIIVPVPHSLYEAISVHCPYL